MAAVKVQEAHSSLDLNGTVTRFCVKSWSVSDSAFLVRSSASGTSRAAWTAAWGPLELHVAEPFSLEGRRARLPLGSRSRLVWAGVKRGVAIAWVGR